MNETNVVKYDERGVADGGYRWFATKNDAREMVAGGIPGVGDLSQL